MEKDHGIINHDKGVKRKRENRIRVSILKRLFLYQKIKGKYTRRKRKKCLMLMK